MKQAWQFFKRYQVWIFVTIVVMAMLYSIWHHFNQPSPVTESSPTPTPSATSSPSSLATPNILTTPSTASSPTPSSQAISNRPILFPDIDATGQQLFYLDPDDNYLKQQDLTTGSVTGLAELSAYVTYLAWSPDHSQILLTMTNEEGNDVANPLYQDRAGYGDTIIAHYILKTKHLDRLNNSITTYAWLGNSQIIYQYQNGIFNNLSIANPDGTNWKNIASPKGDAYMFSAGNTAVVQIGSENKVTRYKIGGQSESYNVPAGFSLSKSAWQESGLNALYWASGNGGISIHHLTSQSDEIAAHYDSQASDFTILWDNKKGTVYLASYNGFNTLPNPIKP